MSQPTTEVPARTPRPSGTRWPILVSFALMLSGCSSAAAIDVPAVTSSHSSSATTSLTTSYTSATALPNVVKPAPLTPPSGLGFSPTSTGISTATVDGGAVTLMWMDPQKLKFRFIPGYKWPEHSPTIKSDHAPSTWTSTMLAAFNGGFKLSDNVGGYYYHGHTVANLRGGLGAFEVLKDGTLKVGVWGRDLTLTPQTVAVRENLPPIVASGKSRTSPSDNVGTWGLALHHLWHVNRSALGERSDGSLIFEFGHHITPTTIAHYLVEAGVRDAVMLDMNETWPTGFIYRHNSSGIHGKRINPAIVKGPDLYLQRADKDFVVVSARQK